MKSYFVRTFGRNIVRVSLHRCKWRISRAEK